MPSAFVPVGSMGGKGSLLRGVERFERAIGRVHGRRLLLRWLAKQADKQQKYNPKKRFVNSRSVGKTPGVSANGAMRVGANISAEPHVAQGKSRDIPHGRAPYGSGGASSGALT
jgi:hypothetical protein